MPLTVTELQTLKAHGSDVTSCDLSSNYILATASSDKTVRLWGWKPGLGFVEEATSPLMEHKYGVTCVTFSPQSTMLASSSIDGATVLWSSRSGAKICKFSQVNGEPVRVCRFNKDSCTLVTAGDNGLVCVWDVVRRTLLRTIRQHEEAVYSLDFSPDSSFLLTTCNLGVIKLYYFDDVLDSSREGVEALMSLDDTHDLGVLSCDFSNVIQADPLDSTMLQFSLITSGNDQCLRMWTLRCRAAGKHHSCKTEMIQAASEAHSSSITCVRFSWSGDLVCSSSMDRTVKLWDFELNCLLSVAAHSRYVNCVTFSKHGDLLCTGSNDKSVKVWDLSGGGLGVDSELNKPCKMLSHFGCGDLAGIATLQEEDIVMLKGSQEDNEVILIQSIDNVHSVAVNCLEFSSEGILATGSSDKSVRLLKNDDVFGMYTEFPEEGEPFARHEYQVNGVTFLSSSLLASCSLDGSIHLWRLAEDSGRPIRTLISQQMTGVKCVRASVDGKMLLAAHDDGTAMLWDLGSPMASPAKSYPAHVDGATCCAISPDARLTVTASSSGDLKVYALSLEEVRDEEPILLMDCAHDLGVLDMDFAKLPEDFPSFNLLPLGNPKNQTTHLLATCGNDCLAKVWKITLPEVNSLATEKASCVEWRIYAGHGSNVTAVRFPAHRCDLLCSTSADKQARIWSVYSAQCLHVLEHASQVTSCSFSSRGALVATACLSGQICVWKLPRNLVFETNPEQAMRSTSRNPVGWTCEEVMDWLKEVGDKLEDLALKRTSVNILANHITGREILAAAEESLPELLSLDLTTQCGQEILQELKWLRFTSSKLSKSVQREPPHHLLCPITHCLMMQPVKCSDGFTYEKSAIQEWFLSGGKYVSPITNQPLLNSTVTPNRELRREIMMFLFEEEQ